MANLERCIPDQDNQLEKQVVDSYLLVCPISVLSDFIYRLADLSGSSTQFLAVISLDFKFGIRETKALDCWLVRSGSGKCSWKE